MTDDEERIAGEGKIQENRIGNKKNEYRKKIKGEKV